MLDVHNYIYTYPLSCWGAIFKELRRQVHLITGQTSQAFVFSYRLPLARYLVTAPYNAVKEGEDGGEQGTEQSAEDTE